MTGKYVNQHGTHTTKNSLILCLGRGSGLGIESVHHPTSEVSSILTLVGFLCTFLFSWQAVFRISDGALNVMFKFFRLLLEKISNFNGSVHLKILSQHFPSSVVLARKVQSSNHESFSKYVVCQRCYTTYQFEDCLKKDGVNKCTFVRFPRHPQKRMRVPCGCSLLKVAKTASGKHISSPLKVFCYRSIIQSVNQIVQQPGMLDMLNKWKMRNIPSGIMADIYDGSVWKSFQMVDGEEFLSS